MEDTEYLVKENPENDFFDVSGQVIFSIDRNGSRQLLHHWEDDEFKHLPKIKETTKNYLRFEYQHGTDGRGNPKEEWLHVIKEGKEWY